MSRPSATTRSRATRSPSSPPTASARHPARSYPGARPGLYAITLAGAERSFTYWRSDAAARRLADDPAALEKSLENRALVYFSGITLAILEPQARAALLAALGKARRQGSLIAFDPNYRPRLWPNAETARAAIIEALQLTDIALPTFPDEQALFGDADPQATAARIEALGVGEIVVKNGEAPALVLSNGGAESVPAIHVPSPVDTTGAGDSFNGAYLAARLAGVEPVDAARKAHRVAAAVVQVRGALAPFEVLRRHSTGRLSRLQLCVLNGPREYHAASSLALPKRLAEDAFELTLA